MLSRLPVRVRVTLAFAAIMAAVLAGTGLFVYLRLASELDAGIERGLSARTADAAAVVRESGPEALSARAGGIDDEIEDVAQVLDGSGRVLGGTAALGTRPLLTGAEARRASRETISVDRRPIPGGEGPARLLATPTQTQDGTLVVVAGASLDDRDDALASLAALLAIGGLVALVLACAAGYGAVAAALRPVERMRRGAQSIQDGTPGRRLPVAPARDEIARLGETLNAMLARLEAALAREREFVADASHELRTPLSILKAELELALAGGRTVDELESALRSASEETDRLVQLSEDLLVIARSDDRGLPVSLGHVSASGVLSAVAERFAGRARAQGAQLEVVADPSLAVFADSLRVTQAVGNMVDNALREGAGHVELVATGAADQIELHVRDDGPGLPPAFIPQAFKRFTRADTGRTGGGAGLGLAIVAAIARAHGGAVGARNREKGGADVWLTLPTAEQHVRPEATV